MSVGYIFPNGEPEGGDRGGKGGGGGNFPTKKISSYFEFMSSHVVHHLEDWNHPIFDMDHPFDKPYVHLMAGDLSEGDKIYLCRKMAEFKDKRDSRDHLFSERKFLLLRYCSLFF